MSDESRQLAFYLNGAAADDDDLYVMINAGPEDLYFTIQDGRPSDWRRVVDTSRASPDDICEPGQEAGIRSLRYCVKSRSVVVLIRKKIPASR